MGSGIAQVAAQAGCSVHLVDALPGAAAAARERLAATLDRLAGKGRISRDDAAAATARLTVTATVSDLPPCALVIEAIREDLADKRAIFTALAERQPADTPAGEQHLQPGRQRHRRRHRPPGPHPGPALLQPAAADAPGRGGPRGPDRRRGARAGHGADAGVGQDAGAVHLDARLHRQPGRPPLLRRGPADGRGGRGRPRHHRLRPARAGRVPDGSPGADRPDRPGRQPRRRHVGLGADRPGRALRPHRLPAPPRPGRPPRAQDRLAASSRTTTPAAPRGSCPTRTWPGGSWPGRS